MASAAAQQILAGQTSMNGLTPLGSLSEHSVAPEVPVDPTPSQQRFLESMAQGNVPASTGAYGVNYTPEYLHQIAENLTSATVTSATATAYPQARRMLAGWFSLLSPAQQAVASGELAKLAPGLNSSALAAQDTAAGGPSAIPGGTPTADALAEADKIPNESVQAAMDAVVSAMDPTLYPAAGKIAMNSQLISSIISEGITLIGYLTQNAKDALQSAS